VDAGALEGVDTVLGLHLMATEPSGSVLVRAGPMMAAPDTFAITVLGRGGHAAMPQASIDPVAIGAQIVTNLQQLVARAINPLEPIVLSVTQFHAGTADNVIPESAELTGTVRSFDPALRDAMPDLMERVVKGITAAHGASYAFAYERGYRALVNDEAVTERLRSALERALGPDRVATADRIMGGEDFSAYLAETPGAFFMVGAEPRDADAAFPHHHPRFAIDEGALRVGVEAFLAAIEAFSHG